MKYILFSSNQLLLIGLTLIPLVSTNYLINNVRFLLYIDILLRSFPMLFAIIPQIIINHRTNREKANRNSEAQNKIMINCTFEKVEEEHESMTLKMIGFFIILGLVRFISLLLFQLICSFQVSGFGNTINFFCLLVTWVACYYILQLPLSIHHILSLGIILVAAIIEVSLSNKYFPIVADTNFLSLQIGIILFISHILISPFKEVIEKHLMTKYFYSSNTLLVFEGAFSIIMVIILAVITNYVNCENSAFEYLCQENQWEALSLMFAELFNFKSLFTLYTFLTLIMAFFGSYLLMEINKRLTPMHKYITDNLAGVLYLIVSIFRGLIMGIDLSNLSDMLLYILFSLISTIGCFLFNEYIILKCCHLHRDTKKEIRKRAIDENTVNELNISSLSHEALF